MKTIILTIVGTLLVEAALLFIAAIGYTYGETQVKKEYAEKNRNLESALDEAKQKIEDARVREKLAKIAEKEARDA